MMQPIPAPGFQLISGKRNPPDGEGVKYWVQLRMDAGVDCVGKPGWVDEHGPWPVKGPRWKWDSADSDDRTDIVAVRRAE